MQSSETWLVLTCPHCNDYVLTSVETLNCRIFRHGVDKLSFQPLPPHSSKELCDRMVAEQRIYGCGRPFRVQETASGSFQCVDCDYV